MGCQCFQLNASVHNHRGAGQSPTRALPRSSKRGAKARPVSQGLKPAIRLVILSHQRIGASTPPSRVYSTACLSCLGGTTQERGRGCHKDLPFRLEPRRGQFWSVSPGKCSTSTISRVRNLQQSEKARVSKTGIASNEEEEHLERDMQEMSVS